VQNVMNETDAQNGMVEGRLRFMDGYLARVRHAGQAIRWVRLVIRGRVSH